MPGQYSIPVDNPFAGATPGADEIYSYGLRNPWRFSFDRLTGDLTIGDVGYMTWEEIDFMLKGTGRGANFGWNCFEGNPSAPADADGLHAATGQPHLARARFRTPTPGSASVTGGYVIRDGALPSLLGRDLYADTQDAFADELRTTQLFAGGSSGDSGLGVNATNVVSFGEDACAHIYVAAIAGAVYRLEPTDGSFPCMPPSAWWQLSRTTVAAAQHERANRQARRGAQEVQEEVQEEPQEEEALKKWKKKANLVPL